jgi:hypothetical protein
MESGNTGVPARIYPTRSNFTRSSEQEGHIRQTLHGSTN